jgi:hypothetical protein
VNVEVSAAIQDGATAVRRDGPDLGMSDALAKGGGVWPLGTIPAERSDWRGNASRGSGRSNDIPDLLKALDDSMCYTPG